MARFRQANDELRDLVQEQADAAYGAGLRRTVALIVILSAAFAGMAGMLLEPAAPAGARAAGAPTSPTTRRSASSPRSCR